MHLLLPWFLPAAALVGWLGTASARTLAPGGRQGRDRVALLAVAWSPLLIWLLAQFVDPGRNP
ncbi:hypothetical protein [Geothrix sp. 21YS21S-4]|uniref:hypothetical protein n=1 Tax=Geothrix sp. 21YS21S-4 TaxID=3068889 RepID=UPI0027B8E7F1|nr:hypothetical protein [Geothrix sp. 21YS21S-4]